jgi:hypothetical protein
MVSAKRKTNLFVCFFLSEIKIMARKKRPSEDQIECKTLRVNSIELWDEQRGVCGMIDVSPLSGKPCISLFGPSDGNISQGISLSLGTDGQASIGIAGKDVLVVGMSASPLGHRSVFVLDDNGRVAFEAGIDRNGFRFIKLVATDGSTLWEATDKNKATSQT